VCARDVDVERCLFSGVVWKKPASAALSLEPCGLTSARFAVRIEYRCHFKTDAYVLWASLVCT
jgi:hypothetical protein